eukprot:scaffold248807_cov22-Tisochrysis_lutea.AAC.1
MALGQAREENGRVPGKKVVHLVSLQGLLSSVLTRDVSRSGEVVSTESDLRGAPWSIKHALTGTQADGDVPAGQ